MSHVTTPTWGKFVIPRLIGLLDVANWIVRCEATHFAMAATNYNERIQFGRNVVNSAKVIEVIWDELRWDEMRWVIWTLLRWWVCDSLAESCVRFQFSFHRCLRRVTVRVSLCACVSALYKKNELSCQHQTWCIHKTKTQHALSLRSKGQCHVTRL